MSPATPSDSRLKWRKRKRDTTLGSTTKRQKPQDDDDEDYDDDEEAAAVEDDDDDDQDSPADPNADPVIDLREKEVLSDAGHRISDFPAVLRRSINRPHPSVLALVAAELSSASRSPRNPPFLENISHGQLQALSSVLPDNPSLAQVPDHDKPSAYVCTPPTLMEGKGVVKRFGGGHVLIVPVHADWFSPTTVHRLERQVVPHFFSGKSGDNTPEKYMALRNKIVSKYMENPGRRLSFADCQGILSGYELYDLSRIVRFLDHWGIINYLAASSVHRGPRMAGSLLQEDANGELRLQATPLRSIDSLIQFERSKCSIKAEDIAFPSSSSSSSSALMGSDVGVSDLDSRIRERLSEHVCSYCSRPLPYMHYQSQKEADVTLCSDCFHDAKFIIGHSTVDFIRVDSTKDTSDLDGDSWTDQETLLLLEALEKYNDNWNEIAEHVGTKSKAQCILHFIRIPMEDGLLENIELPHMAVSSDASKGHNHGPPSSLSNGAYTQDSKSGNQLPFANSKNPVMSLVAFLASAIGPRVAATCASAALSILTKEDPRLGNESMHREGVSKGAHTNFGHQKDGTLEDQVPYSIKDATSALSPEGVKYAANCGLSAAAMKAKLFADQEEREIQRLAATIINHQLKRLELKLKQFAEVETLLLKECEQVERTRQRLSTERVRMMSARFAPAGPTSLPATAGAVAANTNARPPGMAASVGQANVSSSAYVSNLPTHPHMPFMQRQQMFAFGPRLPLSAIHPSSAAPTANVMLPSGTANTSAPNHHPLLRHLSGNNSNIG